MDHLGTRERWRPLPGWGTAPRRRAAISDPRDGSIPLATGASCARSISFPRTRLEQRFPTNSLHPFTWRRYRTGEGQFCGPSSSIGAPATSFAPRHGWSPRFWRGIRRGFRRHVLRLRTYFGTPRGSRAGPESARCRGNLGASIRGVTSSLAEAGTTRSTPGTWTGRDPSSFPAVHAFQLDGTPRDRLGAGYDLHNVASAPTEFTSTATSSRARSTRSWSLWRREDAPASCGRMASASGT
jgi:hypothetical protein